MRFTEVKDIKLIVTLKIFDFSLSGKNVLTSVYSIFAWNAKNAKKQRRKIFKLAKSISGPFFTYKETNDSQYFSQGCDIKTLYNGIMIKKQATATSDEKQKGNAAMFGENCLISGTKSKTFNVWALTYCN